MPKLQCPKCKQPIEIKALPADNKVKCSSCSAEFTLKAPVKAGSSSTGAGGNQPAAKPTASQSGSVAQPSAKASPSATKQASAKSTSTGTNPATADPNDPFASLDLNTIGKAKRVDLGVAPIPTGVAESPVGNNAPWLAENKPAYTPISESEASAIANNPFQASDGSRSPGRKKSNLGMNIFVIVVLLAMAGGSLAAAIIVAIK